MKDKNRRKIIGGAGAGVLLPATWVKPAVDSVVLPAHARTSLFECTITGQTNVQAVNGVFSPDLNYTITNTGGNPLTGTSSGIGSVTSGVGFSTTGSGTPNPLNPGDTHIKTITQITTGVCPTTGEQIRISFNSNETSCELLIDVSCLSIG